MKLLTIIIPCKNEEKYIGTLLDSLAEQTYPMNTVDIIIADAGSTDSTLNIINECVIKYNQLLNIRIVPGGLPAIGRNNGAKTRGSSGLL